MEVLYMSNTYYWTCPYCNANLDPGEKCDCTKEKENNNSDTTDNYKSVRGGEKVNDKLLEK